MQDEKGIDNFIANKKILVTGAAGLVGSELTKQLLGNGYVVVAIYNVSPVPISHPRLAIKQCDILDTSSLNEIMQDITNVYHCAALVSYDPKDKAALYKINVEGTANVVNACLTAHVQKLVHVSSVAALERAPGEPITEQMTWTEETNKSDYGRSKYFGELEVWRGIGEGLNAVIVNPSVIIGGNNWSNGSGSLFKSAYDEFRFYTHGSTGFVDVRDIASAMIMLMKSKIFAERFILNAENISYKELFTIMAVCFNKKPPSIKATSFMSEIVWRAESLKGLFTNKKRLLTKETTRTAQAMIQYGNSKFLKEFPGFSYRRIEDSIKDTCATLKEQYNL